MNLKRIFLTLVIASTVLSCKDTAKDESKDIDTTVESINTFKVTAKVIVKKDDDFCLLYTQDGSIDFKDGVWQVVKGSENEQTVEFSLPEDVFPTQLRLDLGRNKEQEDILIKSVKFEYLGNERELVGAQIGAFFRADVSKCTYDYETGVIKGLVIDNVKQSPSLYPHESVQAQELPNLMK
jgi:hypothetical protein